MIIEQTATFDRQVKQLHKNQKKDLDLAIKKIVDNPSIGDRKKGDLIGVQVYKFKMAKQLTLLAYEFCTDEQQLVLLTFGVHQNFYRDLKK